MTRASYGTSRRRLLILGAHGFGREVLWMASDIPASDRDWEISGFLDDDVDGARQRLDAMGVSLPLLGAIRDHRPSEAEAYICAMGSAKARLFVGEFLSARGASFITLVHPSARIHQSASIGVGLIMAPLSSIGPGCRLGEFVVLNPSANVGPDVVIEDGGFVGARCDLMEGAHLERGAFLGSHATVHPRVRIGAFATVGIGSTVLHRTSPDSTVMGVPAKSLGL